MADLDVSELVRARDEARVAEQLARSSTDPEALQRARNLVTSAGAVLNRWVRIQEPDRG